MRMRERTSASFQKTSSCSMILRPASIQMTSSRYCTISDWPVCPTMSPLLSPASVVMGIYTHKAACYVYVYIKVPSCPILEVSDLPTHTVPPCNTRFCLPAFYTGGRE
ncbi:hypothetical protein FKM82_012527 [Ascaphus truei]